MNPEQELCEAVVELLTTLKTLDGLPSDLQILAKHATAALARPSLLVAPEDFTQRGNKLLEGVLLLRLRSDGDAEPIATSQATLDAAAAYLLLGGKAELVLLCQSRGVWLRKFSLAGAVSNEAGDRGRAYEQRLKVWVQTSL
jgi:hypothetical protein